MRVPAIVLLHLDWRLALVAFVATSVAGCLALYAWYRERRPREAGLGFGRQAPAPAPASVQAREPRPSRRQLEALRKREEQLKDQVVLLEMAFGVLPQGLSMVDADRRLLMCNKRFADMYGMPEALTKPGTPLDLLVEHRIASGAYAGTDPDVVRADAHRPLTKTTIKTRYLTGGRVVLITRTPTPNGGWVATHEDITERRRLQEMEREAKETLATVFNTVPAAIICLSPDRRVMLWSRGAEHIFGYTAEETVGQPYKLVPLEGKAEFDALFERAIAGDTLRDVYVRRRRKDGSLVEVSVSAAPMRDREGDVRGIVYALDDISEKEKLTARLKEQHELLRQREDKLKAQNEQLDAALSNMMQGLAMFDAEERLVLANAQYAELFGLRFDEIKPGMTLRQIMRLRVARGLYPGQTVGQALGELRQRTAQGISSHLVVPGNGRVILASVKPRATGGWVVTVQDITEQDRLKGQLEARNEQLDAALNNMSQGLAMFDSDERLLICNRHYAEMYGLTMEDVKSGTTVRQTLENRLKKGLYDSPAVVDELYARFGQRTSDIHRLADGRIIHVTYRRTASGGYVITHEDITERERLTAQLEVQHTLLKQQEETLKAQNMQLDAALNNMAQGLAMFDSNLRLVMANEQYAELYRLSPELVRPGTSMRTLVEQLVPPAQLAGRSADEVVQGVFERVRRMEENEYTFRIMDGRYIVVCLKPMRNGYLVTTHHDITEQRRSEEKIVHMALHDALTGLPNRILFHQRLEHALSLTKRAGLVALHLLDLDHFKNVNDTLGHPAGDKLLKGAAERLRKVVRETDVIARMGGDEFAIVQTIAQPAEAGVLARRVIEAVSEPYQIDGHQAVIGTSIGIAIGPTDSAAPDHLMRNADLALYRAKADGRGACRFFEAGMDAKMQERRAMEHDLRKGLVAGEFELLYQPIINLGTNEISGFEALLRWHHPLQGLILPEAFIPVAEEVGFIVPLGEWVIRNACATATRWPGHVKVAVNVSPVQFRSSGLVQVVVNALAASGLAPERLQLEITEATLLHDSETVLSILYQLKEMGVCIAIDDFGTGYSSLSYLQSFPFARIKIDRSFVKDIADDVGSLNIVRAVAALAKGLGMDTTAEGVETQLQRDKVTAEGCTEMQGFLFSQPRAAEEIAKLFFGGREEKPDAADANRPPTSVARAAGQ
jgi:diguanylate cyclase (GGDEF)-like protein/PAS domain S-box-containing protein